MAGDSANKDKLLSSVILEIFFLSIWQVSLRSGLQYYKQDNPDGIESNQQLIKCAVLLVYKQRHFARKNLLSRAKAGAALLHSEPAALGQLIRFCLLRPLVQQWVSSR